MLLLASKLDKVPVMSLQTGAELAETDKVIIDPSVLDIVAYTVEGPRLDSDESTLLLTRDIREVSDIGFIIDSADELMLASDIIKIQNLQKLNFQLLGIEVIDDAKQKLGKIIDYTYDPMTFTIHQLYVKRPLLQSLQTSQLIINRTQIVEINNKNIVVSSTLLNEKPKPALITNDFINPFRKPSTPSASRQ